MERLASIVERLLVTHGVSYRRVYSLGFDQVKISLGSQGSLIIFRDSGILYCRDEKGHIFKFEKKMASFSEDTHRTQDETVIISPTTGKLKEMYGKANSGFKKTDLLFVIESMKMETLVRAPFDLEMKNVYCSAGDSLKQGQKIADITKIEK